MMSWEEKAPIPVAYYAHIAVKIGKLIYVGNGYDELRQSSYEIHVYNTTTDTWNSPISIDYRWFAMTALNNKLLIVGGKSKDKEITDKIFKLDNATNQMEFYAKMKTARSWCTAITHNDIVIIIGGKDANQVALSSIELFDSTSETWHSCNLPSPHYLLSPVIVNNNLYLVAGVNHHHKTCHKVFVASLNTLSKHELKWQTHRDVPYLCSAPVCVNGTDLLVLGGSTECHHEYSSDIYRLDQDGGSWVKIGNLPFERNLMAAVSMDDGGVVVIGGTKNKGVAVNTVWKGFYTQA